MKLEEFKNALNKENINIFEVVIGEKIFDTSFDFEHFEDYLKFLLLNKINQVLIEIKYKDADDFIISNMDINQYKDVYSKTFIKTLKEEVKNLDKVYNKQLREQNTVSMDDYLNNVLEINKINVIIQKVEGIDVSAAKDLADRLSDKLGQSVIVLAIVSDKVVFVVKSKVKEVNAGQIAKMAAMITLGNGGGRPDFAQAGGKDVSKVDEALQTVKEELNKLL